MPNWCENKLTVLGPSEDVLKCKDAVYPYFDFNVYVPEPEDIKTKDVRQIFDWRYLNWGTKWIANNVKIENQRHGFSIYFETAWTPPRPVIFPVSAKFPNLRIKLKYWETGVGFRGFDVFCNGRAIKSFYEEYDAYKSINVNGELMAQAEVENVHKSLYNDIF